MTIEHHRDRDGGYKSRKMVMAYFAMILITGGFAATGVWVALGPTYGTFCASILTAATIYTGGNYLTKAIGGKSSTTSTPSSKGLAAPKELKDEGNEGPPKPPESRFEE